jgi:hypothetical protein
MAARPRDAGWYVAWDSGDLRSLDEEIACVVWERLPKPVVTTTHRGRGGRHASVSHVR